MYRFVYCSLIRSIALELITSLHKSFDTVVLKIFHRTDKFSVYELYIPSLNTVIDIINLLLCALNFSTELINLQDKTKLSSRCYYSHFFILSVIRHLLELNIYIKNQIWNFKSIIPFTVHLKFLKTETVYKYMCPSHGLLGLT